MVVFGNSDKCCWCEDKRTPEEMQNPLLYIDGIGELHPNTVGVKWPRDIGYCPKCRKTRTSTAALYQKMTRLIKLSKAFT